MTTHGSPRRSRRSRRPRRAAALAALLLTALLPLAGCGSRLPERDFTGGTAGSAAGPAAGPSTGALPPITVGIISSVSSALGVDAFSGPMYGAQAFFRALNDAGGLGGPGGRRIKVLTCDDSGSGAGNQSCVHQLIDQDHVVALVATSALDYAGAPYVSAQGVPDVGGEPIDTAYDRYPHLYQLYGSSEPRDGKHLGWNGTQYLTTEVYRYFSQRLGLHSAAVVSYNQADSARYAAQLVQGLKAEGYQVLTGTVDFALPNFAAVAAQLKAHGTQLLLDAMDTRGNVALCQAMASAGVTVTAKVTNVQNWNARAGSDYQAVPGCLDALWVTSASRSYTDVRYPAVAAFRAAMKRYYPDREPKASQWELEGWAAAQWFADAAGSCGAQVDRACVDRYMQRPEHYDAHGLLVPTGFTPGPAPVGPQRACLDVARWVGGPNGGWVTQVPDMDANCFQVPALPYHS